jgi:muramoyltetrapeptide carboxypeptidase
MRPQARTELRRPARLHRGDRAAVVAPSGVVDRNRLDRGCEVLRGIGLSVTVAEHVLDQDGYLAGSDRDRAADLQRAWLDPAVAAVVCARGGYGATRVLDHLDWATMAAAEPKVFLGGSDLTALHGAFAARLGVATLFGPMPATQLLGNGEPNLTSLQHLRDTLLAPEAVRVLGGAGTTAVEGGRAHGVTCGGTLTLLAAAAGTPDLRYASGGIALLEDVGEEPYRIDRMLTQLLRAGWFDGVSGVALGSWVRCGEGAADVLAERLSPLGVPLLAGLPFGHGRPQLTVPLGVPAELDADAGTLTCDLPALS